MRTIRFRGKRLDNQEWVYGGISIFEGEATIYDENDLTNSAHEVDINTVGQFSGEADKDGNEVYEDDIYLPENSKEYYLVSFSDGAFNGGVNKANCSPLFWQAEEDNHGELTGDLEPENFFSKWGICGNIHDNPELLK